MKKKKEVIIIISAVLFAIALFVKMNQTLQLILMLVAYILLGKDTVLKAVKNVEKGDFFDENFLMTIATLGAIIIGEYPEAVAVMLFYEIGELFQSYAINKSRKSIADMMDIKPEYANVIRDNKSQKVDPDEVQIGETIEIKPGERVPLDAIIIKGETTLDTSALTGESVPVEVREGATILSGCININALILAKVTKEYFDSTVNKVLDLVENAASKKSTSERLITRFAKIYTPIVIGLAVLLAIFPPIISGEYNFRVWIFRALSFLVVSCPCAFVISVPLSFFSGIGAASRAGILIKGGNYLEILSKVDIVVLDKTGTLTKGVFNVQKVVVLDKNIKEASGIADIDIVFSPAQTTGKILLNNFNYKTKDNLTLVDNINADISVDNRKLNVNRLDGGYNGGTFTVDGNLDVPVIPEDFMRTKRLELGKFELNASLNSVKVRYGQDIDAVVTGDIVFTENHLFGNITAESGEIRAIPSFGGEKKSVSAEEQEKILKNKTIVEGIVEEVIDKILKQYIVDINLRANKDVKLNIPSISLVKNIKGGISGESKVLYENGEVGLIGEYTIRQGSFVLNNNRFKIDNAEIRFPEQSTGSTLQIDPFIVFNASTKVGKERIEVSLTGKVSNPDIKFSSDSGLSREQIVSLLAFNTASKGNNKNQDNKQTDSSQDGTVLIGSVLNTALNELIFSPVTGKIGETLGLSNVSVSTDFKKSEKTGEYSGATTLYIQDNLYKEKWFWNLQVKFPFQTKTENGNTSNPVGYNAWINYNVFEGLELKIGGETITKKDESTNFKPKNDLNYYFGVDFSTKADSFGDLWKKLFRRKKLDTLSK